MEPYTLIVFLDEANINNIDIVPSDWLYCDKDDNLLCPFVNDLTEKNKKEIIKRVKTLSCPDKSWKAFRVDVAGTAANHRGPSNTISAPHLIRSSLNLLEDLPAARDVILDYFSLVFDVAVGNYIASISQDIKNITEKDEAVSDVQEALENLVSKGPPAWAPLIANWSLELIGRLSNKYWPARNLDIGAACNLWLNCSSMKSLLSLMASCFRKMTNSEAEICISTLLATFRKHTPSFDWVVARLGGIFPLKITSQILQCGLKKFSEDVRSRLDSEIGILDYLSFAHEKDLKFAIKELLEEGFYPKKQTHINIVPYLLQVSTFSENFLQLLVSVFLEMYNEQLIDIIVPHTNIWMQNFVFRDMQPSLNNIILKLKTNGIKLLMAVAKISDKFSWCLDFIEFTIQELELIILENRICPILNDFTKEESKNILWKNCCSTNFIEQQTSVRLLLLASCHYPRLYNQTIAELLMKSYDTNNNGIGALIRILGGSPGIINFPETSPGIEMALEFILIEKQFHFMENQKKCLNAIKNLVTLAKLEKGGLSPHLKHLPIHTVLNENLYKLLNIFDCLLVRVMSKENNKRISSIEKTTNSKRIKIENCSNDLEYEKNGISTNTNCAEVIHTLVLLLNTIDVGAKYTVTTMPEILKLSQLLVKYFFWCLNETKPILRNLYINRNLVLFRRLCGTRKSARMSCLRDLIEGSLFFYSHLFGSVTDIEIERNDALIPNEHKLIYLNQKNGLGPTAIRSALHAGIIGKGIKSDSRELLPEYVEIDIQNYFLKALDACCYDQEKSNNVDGYSTISLLLVEMVSSDVMYNGLPFPDEELTKVTMERDLQIRRTFKASPILWSILTLVATHRPALCFASVLLRALCASFLHQSRARNVNRFEPPNENDELILSIKKLLQILALGQLVPHPISNLHMVIGYFEAPEIALVLKESVWNYMKDNVPSPALFQCDNNGLHWRISSLSKPHPQYTDTLRNIMQKKLPKLGSFYHQMFVMPATIEDISLHEQNL